MLYREIQTKKYIYNLRANEPVAKRDFNIG